MTHVAGVPTTRVSEAFIRERLLQQIQYNQHKLFQVQTQLSTGYRFQVPGEAPIAASRVIRLQRLIEQKLQAQSNLATTQSYLGSTDVALHRIADLMIEARSLALSVTGTLVSREQREAVALQVGEILRQLIDAGNQNFRGRYLFAGADPTVRPFEETPKGYIEYRGNLQHLSSFVDVDLLATSNVHGHEVFGALSEGVVGQVDLDPIVSPETRLADLRGGQGVTPGSIILSDGTPEGTVVVDLSTAETVGDVARLLMANAPPGRKLNVGITPRGLVLQLDPSTGGNLIVAEVGEGTTARQLGIHAPLGVGTGLLIGEDLDPALRPETSLGDVLGARAVAFLWLPGEDNDIILEAMERGERWNDVKIRFVADPLISAGNEVVSFDPDSKSLEIRIAPYETQARHVVAALNRARDAGHLPFTARLDPLDFRRGGVGWVPVTPPGQWAAITAWGAGQELDQTSGLRILNGDEEYVVDISAAKRVEDLLNILSRKEYGLLATIDASAKKLVVRTRRSGADFAIGENGGMTATQLGIRSFSRQTRLADLNFGRGVNDYQGRGDFAAATFRSPGADNDLVVRARTAGAEWNDFLVRFVNSGGGSGSEYIRYDPATRTIEVAIVPGVTRAKDVIRLFDTTPEIRDYFVAELAGGEGATEGLGLVQLGEAVTAGGFAPGAEFRIIRADGVMFEVDITGCQTIGDVLDRINNHPTNQASGSPIVARLARFGNGIELVDTAGPGNLRLLASPGQLAAIQLGLLPPGAVEAEASIVDGQQVLTGREVAPLEAEGLFTALIRLRHALLQDDVAGIERAIGLLDRYSLRLNYVRAELGARQQSLEVLKDRLETEMIDLRSVLAQEYEIDLAQVVSELVSRQVALEAALKATAEVYRLTLLSFL
jgi:flagellar hook-associated protein 3 FlgL